MRILQLTETLHAGGAETFVVRLSNALAKAGHEVTVAVALPIVNPAVRAAIDPRVSIEIIPLPGWRWWSKAESALRRAGVRFRPLHWRQKRWLQQVVKRLHPAAIHSHLLKADLLAVDVRGASPRPRHVITIHGDYGMYLSGSADPFLPKLQRHIRRVAKSADAIVGVAKDHLDLFRVRFNVRSSRVHLIYNGYERIPASGRTKSDLGLPEGKFIFGMVARGIREKGWSQAVSAFTKLARPDVALVLVGEGSYLSELRKTVTHPNVHFFGFSAEPSEVIRHFDVGVLPSYFAAESLPTVIIEYLAYGKPVIATDVGEVKDMLSISGGERAGIIIDSSDQNLVDQLAEAMLYMMNEPAELQQYAKRAKAAFAKFDMRHCVKQYEAVFRSVLAAER